MRVITRKPGGLEIFKKIKHIRENGIRVVDRRFATDKAYLDLIEMAVYIYVEVDTVRDDLRDGRYHKHSKSTTDYIIDAQGGLEDGRNVDVNMLTLVKDILKEPINLRFNQFDTDSKYGYIKARPDYFDDPNKVPAEERAVKRTYKIKEYNIFDKTFKVDDEKKQEREPNHLNPAFDRRALNRGSPLIHWGRMYYYEDTEGINKWSENPYPHISTRGVAKYMMYWIATKTFNLSQASDAADQIGQWDIGIRRPLVGGPFIKNPFKDIISIGQ